MEIVENRNGHARNTTSVQNDADIICTAENSRKEGGEGMELLAERLSILPSAVFHVLPFPARAINAETIMHRRQNEQLTPI